MKLKPKIYFAHPYRTWKREDEARIIEKLEERGFEVVNPYDKEQNLLDKFGTSSYYKKPSRKFALAIFTEDFDMLNDCDWILVYCIPGAQCIGTIMEATYAYERDYNIISICQKPQPMLYIISDEFYLSLEDFERGNELILPNE